MKQELQPRPSMYLAPSWSWASVNGIVAFAEPTSHDFASEVLSCDVTLENEEVPTGRVPELVTCFRISGFSGILLVPTPTGTGPTFQRVGFFEIESGKTDKECLRICEAWFSVSEVLTIVIA